MGIKFIYRCDGCNNVAEGGHVSRTFLSVSGKSHGIGSYHIDADPVRDAPDGWTPFCIVGATYCIDCTEKLEKQTPRRGDE